MTKFEQTCGRVMNAVFRQRMTTIVAIICIIFLVVVVIWGAVRHMLGGGPLLQGRVDAFQAHGGLQGMMDRLSGTDSSADGPLSWAMQNHHPRHALLQQTIQTGEQRCRSLAESMLGVPMPKVRPGWLRNPATGRNLELDMYNGTAPSSVGPGFVLPGFATR